MEDVEQPQSGLKLFGDQLHPDVLKDIGRWADDPELSGLRAALMAHTSRTTFFDQYAEALVARHLQQLGCQLRFEVETPSGKSCDFEVHRGDQVFYLHVKRLQGEPMRPQQLTISPRLRYLERVKRPYIVRVRWRDDLDDELMQRFVSRAAQFIKHARVGDEMVIRDEADHDGGEGAELGAVRVVAPWSGTNVSLAIGLPTGFIDQTPRMRKLMERAYLQFMPRALNMILVCSMNPDDSEDFQNALLGSHIERWDITPPRGRRIAHGRDEDGFWQGGRYAESVAAGWFAFDMGDDAIRPRLWQRKGFVVEPPMQSLLAELFGRSDRR
ncbi:MAG: hypothetical protein ACYTGC_01715 [Planctomycetota bacterium]|jgi:hypothetical protein